MSKPLAFPFKSPGSLKWRNAVLGTERSIEVASEDRTVRLAFEVACPQESSFRVPLSFGKYLVDLYPVALPKWDRALQGASPDILPESLILALAMEQIAPALDLLEALLEVAPSGSRHAAIEGTRVCLKIYLGEKEEPLYLAMNAEEVFFKHLGGKVSTWPAQSKREASSLLTSFSVSKGIVRLSAGELGELGAGGLILLEGQKARWQSYFLMLYKQHYYTLTKGDLGAFTLNTLYAMKPANVLDPPADSPPAKPPEALKEKCQAKSNEPEVIEQDNPEEPEFPEENKSEEPKAVQEEPLCINPREAPAEILLELGRLCLPFQQLASLKRGYTFTLPNSKSPTVTLRVSGCAIGKGQLVDLGDKAGVEITSIYS